MVEWVETPVEVATSVTVVASGDIVARLPITAAPAVSHPLEPALLPQAEGLPHLPQQRSLHPLVLRQVQTTVVVAPMATHVLPGYVGKSSTILLPIFSHHQTINKSSYSSKNGYCNTGDDFCGFGCQTSFSPGTCSTCPGSACGGTVTSNPTCSANNGYCWTLSSKKFQIICGRLASGDYLGYVDATSLGDCISKCAANSACVAASFYQGSSTSCSLLSSYQGSAYGNSAGGQQNHAYVRGASCG